MNNSFENHISKTIEPVLAAVSDSVLDSANTESRIMLISGLERIFASLPKGRGWASYPFNTLTLSTAFQPIMSVAERRCVGYEGLLRAHNLTGQALKPETVFALSANHQEELFLDWLCRGLHMRNFANLANQQGMIFLNAYPEAAVEDPHHPEVFAKMIEFYGVQPSQIVIEILETGVSDEAHLVDAVNLYRKLGCKIAIDDFGIGYSNFDRLWRLRPDFVKLDRSVIQIAVHDSHTRLVLCNMVKLIHECGAKVVIEGIEERAEAIVALAAGADYLQGFYFAHPGQTAMPESLSQNMFVSLHNTMAELIDADNDETAAQATDVSQRALTEHHDLLVNAADAVARGDDFADATAAFLAMPHALRAYLMSGDDTDAPISRIVLDMVEDEDLAAIAAPCSASEHLKRVLRRTLAEPSVVQINPTLKDVDAGTRTTTISTLTLSYGFSHQGKLMVLCGDVIIQKSASPSTPRLPETRGSISGAYGANPPQRPHLFL